MDFVNYKKQHYLPEATVLIVAGAVTEKKVMNEVTKVFGAISRGNKVGKIKVKEMISHRLPLAEIQKGFKLVVEAKESVKVIIEPQK